MMFSSVASTPQHPHRHGSPPSSQRANQSRAASDRSSTSGASKGNLSSGRLDFQQQSLQMRSLSGLRGENRTRHAPVQEEVEALVVAKASMLAEDEILRRVPDRRLRRPSVSENEKTVRMPHAHCNGLAVEFERTQANIRLRKARVTNI